MTKQEADAFFVRNPAALKLVEGLKQDGLLHKMDTLWHPGEIGDGLDGGINIIAAYKALGQAAPD